MIKLKAVSVLFTDLCLLLFSTFSQSGDDNFRTGISPLRFKSPVSVKNNEELCNAVSISSYSFYPVAFIE